MAQSLKAKVAAARKAYDKAGKAIFGCAKSGDHPFSTICTYAPAALVERHRVAETRLRDAEAEAIAAGKAYRASFGMLTWHR